MTRLSACTPARSDFVWPSESVKRPSSSPSTSVYLTPKPTPGNWFVTSPHTLTHSPSCSSISSRISSRSAAWLSLRMKQPPALMSLTVPSWQPKSPSQRARR